MELKQNDMMQLLEGLDYLIYSTKKKLEDVK